MALLISSGDVIKSAELGGAIGVAVGATVSYAYIKNQQNKEIELNNEIIAENYSEVQGNESYIDNYRKEVSVETTELEPTTEQTRIYLGY